MKLDAKRIFVKAVTVAALFCMTTQTTFAALLNLAPEPLGVSQVPPKIMLTVSKDQQLFNKAYNDYSDLDGDNVIDTTYKHSVQYYGYFDPFKCYEYANSRFEPRSNSPTKLCTGQWSGNFLNWAAMSRMDAVRKLLYGGLRSTDETFDATSRPVPVTVLERAFLPTDAHAWAKHYVPNPADAVNQPAINQLTPFTLPTAPEQRDADTTGNFRIPTANGDYSMTFRTALTHVQVGDQVYIHSQGNRNRGFTAAIRDITSGGRTLSLRVNVAGVRGGGLDDEWTIVNLSSTGISLCNLTAGSTAAGNVNSRSSTNTNPPLLRVARGNFALWSANERWQCQWTSERSNMQGGFAGGLRTNGNQASLSEINASAENPNRVVHGLSMPAAVNAEYIVRVKVCDPALFDAAINAEKCKRYPNGNLKPTGLLQEYGDNGRFHFGLMTGSHAKNVSGGVLRKNPGPLSDEVRTDSDGTFREANVNAAGVADGTYRLNPYRPRNDPRNGSSAQSPPGIINTLNYMRIYGYLYTDGTYIGASGDNCTYQLTSLAENQCTSWGNPMSEIFFESVRYFAGKTPSAAYTYAPNGSKDNELGLPLAVSRDPLTADTYCANLNVLVFNSSVSDNDDDLRSRPAADINAATTIQGLTDAVGGSQNENINGGRYFIGKLLGTTPTGDPGFELCTAKTITSLGNASGICPEGPTTAGSYHIAGVAHQAKTNHVRADLSPLVPASDTKSLKVSTYGIQLASNTPELVVNGAPGQRIVIQPIYRLNAPGGVGGGALIDMRYVRMDNSGAIKTGKVYVNWDDSEQGGDHDQDIWGTIEWSLNTNTRRITITTSAVSASTANPQGLGYAISGTTRDGPHFHSGIYNFNYTDTTGVLGCTNCNLVGSGGQTGPTSVTYDLSAAAAAGTLKDPLWYAAKYGGFVDSNSNSRPDVITEYDRVTNSTGLAPADGNPDNYFLVTNPLGLVTALGAALNAIGNDSSGTAVMANSTSLSTTSRIYQARYDPVDWRGQLLAKDVLANGTISPTDAWDAGRLLNSRTPTSRVIVTMDDVTTRDGVAFRAGTVSSNLLAPLNTSPVTNLPDGLGSSRLDYLRGETSRELRNGGVFRSRAQSVLGDIVNSDPTYVGPPNTSRPERAYSTFRDLYYSRPPMIYVGANDGMLHGFDALTGAERLAYVPSKVFSNLNKLTDTGYSHRYYVDGPPEAGDAVVGGNWRTVLVGGLGGGGQGLYALDVSNPVDFTEANASRLVLWEFNDTDDADLGYVYGKPVIRQMANGRWAAIVSGGYNNSEGDAATGSGRAFLFVIFLDGPSGPGRTWVQGSDYIKIDTGVGDVATPNGLGAPFVADVDGDAKADFVYAGDLRGNFWKFDLRNTTPSNWASASNRVVLFTAKDPGGRPQPITAQAEGTLHPTSRGYIIVFGTGRYLEVADTLPTFNTQTFYGIWDKADGGANISGQTVVSDRSQLLNQVVSGPAGRRTVPNASPDWNTQRGWFMDFPNSDVTGERAVFRPLIVSSRLIFTTLIPSAAACSGGGTSYLMIIDPATGGRVNGPVFDLNRDGLLNASDQLPSGDYASGIQSTVGITPTPVIVKGGPATGASSSTDKIYGTRAPYLAGPEAMLGFTFMGGPLGITGMWIGLRASAGRVSWREILSN